MTIKIDTLVSVLTGLRNNASLSADQRNATAELAIARGVAYNLPIPADGNITPSTYFNTELAPTAKRYLSEINEMFAYNIQRVYALSYELWMARFNMVHMPQSVESDMLIEALVMNGNTLGPTYGVLNDAAVSNEIAHAITRVGNCFSGNLMMESAV